MGIPAQQKPDRYFVSGQRLGGTASFGIPQATLEDALALCQRRHGDGYRHLRIWDYNARAWCRFSIRTGAGPWYFDPLPTVREAFEG